MNNNNKNKNKNNKTVAAILLLATCILLSPLITPSVANARSSGRGGDRCDPTVNVCVAGTTGSSKDLGKKEQQRQPVAHTQTAPPPNPDNNGKGSGGRGGGDTIVKVPIATSGTNVYLVWSSNKTGNSEVLFRASTDGGKAFSDKINLSNSSKSESVDAEIAASGNNVYVSWWERANQTSNEPVLRVSNDNGKSFGEKIMLSNNATTAKS